MADVSKLSCLRALSLFKYKELISVALRLAEVLFEEIKNDMIDAPYTVKFDEFTTSQVKKKLDIYVRYWSKIYDQVVNGYGGSCFIGHCPVGNLLYMYRDYLSL